MGCALPFFEQNWANNSLLDMIWQIKYHKTMALIKEVLGDKKVESH